MDERMKEMKRKGGEIPGVTRGKIHEVGHYTLCWQELELALVDDSWGIFFTSSRSIFIFYFIIWS